jgi:RNA-binding protein
VGKDGISENVIKQIDDALEARELIKGNVLENSMLSAREVAEELATKTASQVVQVIGNRFILYRRTKKNLCEM